jgi:hypothetical protein
MSLDLTLEGVDQIVADFKAAPEKWTRASVRAMNRAMASARTVMVRAVANDTGLKQKDVRDAIPLTEATYTRFEARIAASLKRIPLIKFNARGPEPSRGRGRGVSYRLKGSRGRLPHGFIATMPSGHRGVFERTPGKFMRTKPKRQAIHEKFGPSLGRVFKTHRPAGIARLQEAFMKNFDHELGFQQSRDAGTD